MPGADTGTHSRRWGPSRCTTRAILFLCLPALGSMLCRRPGQTTEMLPLPEHKAVPQESTPTLQLQRHSCLTQISCSTWPPSVQSCILPYSACTQMESCHQRHAIRWEPLMGIVVAAGLLPASKQSLKSGWLQAELVLKADSIHQRGQERPPPQPHVPSPEYAPSHASGTSPYWLAQVHYIDECIIDVSVCSSREVTSPRDLLDQRDLEYRGEIGQRIKSASASPSTLPVPSASHSPNVAAPRELPSTTAVRTLLTVATAYVLLPLQFPLP